MDIKEKFPDWKISNPSYGNYRFSLKEGKISYVNSCSFYLKFNDTNCGAAFLHTLHLTMNKGTPTKNRKKFAEYFTGLLVEFSETHRRWTYQMSFNNPQWTRGWKYLKDIEGWWHVEGKSNDRRAPNHYMTFVSRVK